MLDDVIGYLICPQCGAALARGAPVVRGDPVMRGGPVVRGGDVLRCARGHAFDIARQGYVSLLPSGSRGNLGDTAAMVQARADFLAAGHFAGLASELASAAVAVVEAAGGDAAAAGCVVDVGAGTGYYLAAMLDRLPGRAGLALDASKFALRRAAHAHRRIGAVAADVWQHLPVRDHAATAVLNVFAPRDGAQLWRILDPAGRLLVVTPNREHLGELVGPLGLLTVDPRKDERLAGKLSAHFDLDDRREYHARVLLDHQEIAAVVAMGPTAWHAGASAERLRGLPDSTTVTVSVTLSIFRPAVR